MIPPGFVSELLERTDIVKVVGRAVSLKKAGGLFKGLCPFHGEKTPSFVVTPQRGTWHCFGCGAHGNAVGFLMDHHGLGFVEAIQDLANLAGVVVPEERPASPAQRAQRQQQVREQQTLVSVLAQAQERYVQQLAATPRARSYLDRRGLNEAVTRTYGLGYAPAGWDFLARQLPADPAEQALWVTAGLVITRGDDGGEQASSQASPAVLGDGARSRRHHDRFRDRVMFPIRSVKGDIIGFGGRVLDQGEPKYLNSPETPVFSKGRELYGLYEGRQAIRKQGYALMVEGYMDVVALAQSGLGNAVATLGTACTADHLHKLLRFTDSVVFAFDGDAAGRRAAVRALQAALPLATDTRRLRFLFLPAEHDPDSYVRELGLDALRAQVDAALPLSRLLLQHVTEGLQQASAEDRALALARAQPLWAQFPEGLLAEQVLIELARWSELSPEAVRRHWQAQEQAQRGPGFGAPSSSSSSSSALSPPSRASGQFRGAAPTAPPGPPATLSAMGSAGGVGALHEPPFPPYRTDGDPGDSGRSGRRGGKPWNPSPDGAYGNGSYGNASGGWRSKGGGSAGYGGGNGGKYGRPPFQTPNQGAFGPSPLPARRAAGGMTGRLDRVLWLLVHDLSLWTALDGGDRALLARQSAPWPQLFAWLGQQHDELGAISAATLQRHLAHAHWSAAPGQEDSAEALRHSADAIARKVLALLPPSESAAERVQDVQTTLRQLHLEQLAQRIERLLAQLAQPVAPDDIDGDPAAPTVSPTQRLREELALCMRRRDALKKQLSPASRDGADGKG